MIQTELAQKFNEISAAAYEVFPQELSRLAVFLTPSSEAPVFVSPEIADQLTKSTSVIKSVIKKLTGMMYDRGWAGYADSSYSIAGTPVNMILLNDENTTGVFKGRCTKDMRTIFLLNHEIGHHILEKGLAVSGVATRQYAESVADAYAMLRHVQLFGKDTDHAGGYGDSRALPIVLLADTDHYTADVIQSAIQISDEMDISALTLRQTKALAEKIAEGCIFDDETLIRIRDAFLPVQKACEMLVGGAWDIIHKLYEEDKEAYAIFCYGTLAVMRQHSEDPAILKAGKQFLSYPAIRSFMTESAKSDPFWQEAIDFVDKAAIKQQPRPTASKLLWSPRQ